MGSRGALVGLWDYGWLSHDTVVLSAATSDAALIEQYVASPFFHTSFLPSDKDETGIHGPFLAHRITPADYVPLKDSGLAHYLESVALSGRHGENEMERAKVFPYLQRMMQQGFRCYVLKVDERNKELLHDWGFVFTIFREILFAGAGRDRLERFVIGYD